ncbi:radical SAM superfamily protein [Microdochium trichocladiopsis]|uniref:Radical SAM superfamily protein n=1 Tax=Microdochium trichocladiopsis TaxID=1682393 RepID=A0A9P8Y6N3_9PEZI|nr:radical SAM superfamily protein [Microdochium trichocladiopsis]KAH7031301.1 radical SAM superfamily protein [Microdochium trichocladiopsis]
MLASRLRILPSRLARSGGAAVAATTPSRSLHLAPPFLLDEYTPRYQQLSSVDAAKKRAAAYAHLSHCNLCPRQCGVNRYEKAGMCLIGENVKVNVIAPHFGEEACIQGHHGSGSVFFSGCNLRCKFCQNHDIAHTRNGQDLTPEQLAQWYMQLQDVGQVHNINLVTPEHVVPQVALSVLHARDLGLRIPIVYNTSAYDSAASLALMDGLVDIYLPDFKVWDPATSRRLLQADDYAATAVESLREMYRQVGDLAFTGDGIAQRGVLVRHLVMPGKQAEGARIMRFLAEELSRDTFVHIMDQYRPAAHVGKPKKRSSGGHNKHEEEVRYAEINRPISSDEVGFVRRAAEAAGLWRFNDPPRHEGFAM